MSIVVAVLAGCERDESRVSGPPLAAQYARQVVPVPNEVPSGEALFAALARIAPSSSGFFFDRLGRIVVNVASAQDGPAAVQAVQGFLARGDIAVPNPASVAVIWRQVKYSFAQLATWRNIVFDSAFTAVDGVVSLDLDEVQNRVRVGALRNRIANARQALVPLMLRVGADTAAIEVIEREPLRPSSLTPHLGYFTWTALYQNADTIVGGLGIGQQTPLWNCTLGFTADHPTWGLGFVTASHCTADIWNVDNRIANQAQAGPVAGTERADPGPWNCGVWQLCRRSDAAYFQRDPSRYMQRGLIARPANLGSGVANASDPYFIVVGESNGYYGQQIYKLGRATFWTLGSILATCIDHNLTGLPGYERTVRCTNESNNPDQGGDSGGPLFLPWGGPFVSLSGTTIGGANVVTGGTGWSTISQIQLDFGNVLGTTRSASLGTPSISGSLNGTSPRLSWSPVSGATRYNVFMSTGGGYTYQTWTANSPYIDGSIIATGVSSSPPPPPWVAYYVSAQSGGNYSGNSNIVYFQRPPAISVSIQGQFDIKPNEGCYWTAAVSGGTGSYTYAWTVNGQPVGSNSSQLLYTNTGSSFTLAVNVTDGSSSPGADSRSISVSAANPSCQF